uniref:Uncharacterized protein n=1 Tax=Avena sativa TaxID=4498 RepID=A0ACD5WI71_AVESA
MFDCCEQKGFSRKWMVWLKNAVTEGTLSVNINDELGPHFGSFKGAKQDDPFSPFLFNLIGENLAKMVKNAQSRGLFTGMSENLVTEGFAIPQYADYTILFIKDDP